MLSFLPEPRLSRADGLRTGVNRASPQSRCLLHGAALLGFSLFANAAEPVHLKRSASEVEVLIGGRSFTTFYFSERTAKPYLMPLRSPSGIVVTRNFPAVNDVSGADLRSPSFEPHQRPLYFAHGNIDGLDFWSEEVFDPLFKDRGAQSCGHMRLKKMERLSGEPGRATVEARFLLLDPSEREMAEETQSYTFSGDARTRTIDCEYRIYATTGPVVIGDTKEGTFAIRLAPELSAPRDHMLDSEGRHGEKEIWGKRANWVSYSGTIGGMPVGIAVFDSPASFRHPTTWMARAYGLVAANPFGVRAFTRDNSRDGSWTIPEGESLRLRYRVLIYDGELTPGELARRYGAYTVAE
jgi:hypothetical protein